MGTGEMAILFRRGLLLAAKSKCFALPRPLRAQSGCLGPEPEKMCRVFSRATGNSPLYCNTLGDLNQPQVRGVRGAGKKWEAQRKIAPPTFFLQ